MVNNVEFTHNSDTGKYEGTVSVATISNSADQDHGQIKAVLSRPSGETGYTIGSNR